MTIFDLLRETYIALSSNKARSSLTILGIVIGIGSVIAMISIGQGSQASIQSNIEGLGSNLLTVSPGFSQQNRGSVSSGRGSAQTLKYSDAEAIKKISGIASISPEIRSRFQIVSSSGNNTNSTVVGALPEYMKVRNVSAENGYFITSNQNQSMSRVAVLGPTTAEDLFGEENPIGKEIRINGNIFKVIGVLQSKGESGFSNQDDIIIVPFSVMQKILSGTDYLSTIAVSVDNKDDMPQIKNEIISVIAIKHNVDPDSPDFSVSSQADILSALTEITNTFTIFLASIAGISLIVGGIGIMNMMLTTVTERTREIGLRKAIGAKKKDINLQFLTEAVMLTFLGGTMGIVLGWVVSILITKFSGTVTQISLWSVILAFGVSAMIGIIFGYYPARRASKLNPIEALRYE
jgi:putative ABC transport system permease protein